MATKTEKPAVQMCVRSDCDRPGTQRHTYTVRQTRLEGGPDLEYEAEFYLCARCSASPYKRATARGHAVRAARQHAQRAAHERKAGPAA